MNRCRSCRRVGDFLSKPQKQVKHWAGLGASFSRTFKIAIPVIGLNRANQWGRRLEEITQGMPEEGLAGDTTKTEARRVHLALRTSGATRRAGSALVNLSTSAPGQPELTRSICENGPCAVPRDVPSSLGHQLVPYTGTDMVQEWVLSQLLLAFSSQNAQTGVTANSGTKNSHLSVAPDSSFCFPFAFWKMNLLMYLFPTWYC